MYRAPRRPRASPLLALAFLAPSVAAAQLRPLDPLDWDAARREGSTVVLGMGMFSGQRAALAGTEGLLVEVGSFRATWGMGRVAVQLAGTALWLYEERTTYAEPMVDVRPADGTRRRDVGDYRISTIVRLTPENPSREVALRFGVRLPTTDNLQGLGRDQMDFFSLLAGRVRSGALTLGGELGLGIYGTRDPRNEQVDPLLFGLSALVGSGTVRGVVELAGHHDTRAGPERRGNEDLGEARLGVLVGGRRWVRFAVVRGWTLASPDIGFTLGVGARF